MKRTPRFICIVGSGGARTLQRTATGWTASEVTTRVQRAIVTNLIDESFLPLDVPALRGADRRSFVDVQLHSRFSASPLRAALPYKSPTQRRRVILTGVANERVDKTIADLTERGVPLSGVWSLPTLLMHRIALAGKKLPPTLLVTLRTDEGLRLLFVHERQPLLSRLLASKLDAQQQSQQLIATRRYLEDNRHIERGAPVPLLALDADPTSVAALQEFGFAVLPVPWRSDPRLSELDRLLDLAHSQPPGQLASAAMRAGYRARRLNRGMIVATGISLCAMLVAGMQIAQGVVAKRFRHEQLQAAAQDLRASMASDRSELQRAGLDVELLQAAQRLQEGELSVELPLVPALQHLSQLLSSQPHAALERLAWTRSSSDKVCAQRAQDSTVAADPTPAAAAGAALVAGATEPATAALPGLASSAVLAAPTLELRVGLTLPKLDSPLQAARQRAALDREMKAWPGAELKTGAAADEATRALVGEPSQAAAGSRSTDSIEYCLGIPLARPARDATAATPATSQERAS